MFKNKFVTCIKANGKVLREFKDIVKLPFGTEFSILLKNLNTVRVQVSVSIDGSEVTENVYLVINPNSEMELTRYIKNGNLNKGNCFKFIERTQGIENHRGIKAEDGIIRVEFQFEKPAVDENEELLQKLDEIKKDLGKKADKSDIWPYRPYYYYPYVQPPQPYWPLGTIICGSVQSPSSGYASGAITTNSVDNNVQYTATSGSPVSGNSTSAFVNTVGVAQNAAYSALRSTSFGGAVQDSYIPDVNEVGITVPGSESNQKFSMTSSFEVEAESHIIVLRLVGTSEVGTQYVAPVTVKSKPTCQTCGRVNKATSKFCSECGTALVIL